METDAQYPLQEEESPTRPKSNADDRQDHDQMKPALVINVQSWATPIIGLVMLLTGLLLGYFGRPLVSAASPSEAAIVPTQINESVAGNANQSKEGSPASTPTLMEFLIGQTRHFKGDPDAPVTLIEFSDFQ